MPLRRSPTLTPAALAARRANALKSTASRTERGKAWSSLNALRHGWDARNLRDKIERAGDKEAAVLLSRASGNDCASRGITGAEATKDVVGTELESRAKSASCPEESGMGAGGRDKGCAKLARLIPRTVRRLFAARRASGPGAESTKDVVGTELESRAKSATCPEEFGGRAAP